MAQDEDAPEGPDVEDAADELYGLHPDHFVPRRTELVKAARAAKDREAATAIGALRKPSLGAWLANVLARESPDEVAALGELGASMRTAQQELSGDALRTLTRQRRELVSALVARARRLARGDGVGVGDSVARDLENTIAAALADDGAAHAFAAGRLTTALEPGVGFSGGVEPSRSVRRPPPPRGSGTAHRPPPRREQAPGGSSGSSGSSGESESGDDERAADEERAAEEERARAREAAERVVERAREERDDADRAAERARTRAEQAESDHTETADAVTALRERLERAEAEEEAAREQRDAARAAREEADAAADEARRALDQAEAERADLE